MGKRARWRLRLQEFEFDVEYLPGRKNRAADAMSRLKTSGGDTRSEPANVDIPVLSTETADVFGLEEEINPEQDDEKRYRPTRR